MIVQLAGGNWNRFLTLGSGSQDPAKISEALKQCALDTQRGWGHGAAASPSLGAKREMHFEPFLGKQTKTIPNPRSALGHSRIVAISSRKMGAPRESTLQCLYRPKAQNKRVLIGPSSHPHPALVSLYPCMFTTHVWERVGKARNITFRGQGVSNPSIGTTPAELTCVGANGKGLRGDTQL